MSARPEPAPEPHLPAASGPEFRSAPRSGPNDRPTEPPEPRQPSAPPAPDGLAGHPGHPGHPEQSEHPEQHPGGAGHPDRAELPEPAQSTPPTRPPSQPTHPTQPSQQSQSSQQSQQTQQSASPAGFDLDQPAGLAESAGPATRQRPWWAEFRPEPGEPRGLVLLAVSLAVVGLVGGVVWSLLAPVERYQVVEGGVRGVDAESEALVGADLVFVAVISVIGLAAAVVLWTRPRWRGPLTAAGLAVGLIACGLVAWQLGEAFRPGPTADELQVGEVVDGPLRLRAWVALCVPPALSLLVYLVCVVLSARDDLGHLRVGRRSERSSG